MRVKFIYPSLLFTSAESLVSSNLSESETRAFLRVPTRPLAGIYSIGDVLRLVSWEEARTHTPGASQLYIRKNLYIVTENRNKGFFDAGIYNKSIFDALRERTLTLSATI